ncbi:Zinc finger protein 468 [Portunus trituberculatus]|uniref:Zinc finger protein 468 n=1 Tax=Portunus trituberculatus TaxID=210409 RepID=A0A5B7EFP6_PORTR|nr:Zinc finger protein 468 [Portunus trituberculatus]
MSAAGDSANNSGSKVYPCEVCGHVFKWPYLLARHYRTHTGEKPYPCPHCTYRTTRREYINRHVCAAPVPLLKEPALMCHVCCKTFGFPSHLKRHMRIHTGERPYACPACPQRFIQKVHLKLHMCSHHGIKNGGQG